MNTVNQTFNWSRFSNTLRKELVENKRAIIFTILGIYGMLTLIMIMGNLTSASSLNVVNDTLAEKGPQKIVAGILSFAIMITASLSFKGLTTKAGRVNMFSCPSSMFEKFLANICIYIIGFVVVFFICAQLADLTRIAALFFFEDADFVVPGPINFLDIWSVPSENIPFAVALQKGLTYSVVFGVLATAGLYLLGSVLWPRLSLLKTLVAFNVIQFILMLIIMPMFAAGFYKGEFVSSLVEFFSTGNNFTVFIISLSIFQAVLFFGLAWYLFKHKDVISLKWWK